jgi:hypothetical protein
MLAFIGGVPRQIVSDNLKSGITRACFSPSSSWGVLLDRGLSGEYAIHSLIGLSRATSA